MSEEGRAAMQEYINQSEAEIKRWEWVRQRQLKVMEGEIAKQQLRSAGWVRQIPRAPRTRRNFFLTAAVKEAA